MILTEENMCYMGQTLNVSNAITMVIALTIADIGWNHLWKKRNASSVITMGAWLKIAGTRRYGKGKMYKKTKKIRSFQ